MDHIWSTLEPNLMVTVPRKLKIQDPQLFIAEKALMIAVFWYFVWGWVKTPHLVQLSETPVSFANFGFERGTFNADRNRSWSSFPYCYNTSYEYSPKGATDYWQDTKIDCKQKMFADLVRIDGTTAYLATYEKATLGVTKDCSTPNYLQQGFCPPTVDWNVSAEKAEYRTILNGGKPYVLHEEKGYSCTCLENKNMFALGPEQLSLSISHIYETSDLTFNLRGASNSLYGGQKHALSPDTTIRHRVARGDIAYDKEFHFAAGEDIDLPVMELLWMAAGTPKAERERGLNPLDQLSSGGGEGVYRRVSGTTVQLDFNYAIELTWPFNGGDDLQVVRRPHCYVEVSMVDGVTGWSLPVQDLEIEPDRRTYMQRVQRGIVFRSSGMGHVWKLDPDKIMAQVVSLAVLIPLMKLLLVNYVAPLVCRIKGRTYKRAAETEFSFEREMAHFGTTATVAMAMFRQWDKDDSGGITRQELADTILSLGWGGGGGKSGGDRGGGGGSGGDSAHKVSGIDGDAVETAYMFAVEIFKKADVADDNDDGSGGAGAGAGATSDGKLTPAELADILGDRLFNMQTLKEYVQKELRVLNSHSSNSHSESIELRQELRDYRQHRMRLAEAESRPQSESAHWNGDGAGGGDRKTNGKRSENGDGKAAAAVARLTETVTQQQMQLQELREVVARQQHAAQAQAEQMLQAMREMGAQQQAQQQAQQPQQPQRQLRQRQQRRPGAGVMRGVQPEAHTYSRVPSTEAPQQQRQQGWQQARDQQRHGRQQRQRQQRQPGRGHAHASSGPPVGGLALALDAESVDGSDDGHGAVDITPDHIRRFEDGFARFRAEQQHSRRGAGDAARMPPLSPEKALGRGEAGSGEGSGGRAVV